MHGTPDGRSSIRGKAPGNQGISMRSTRARMGSGPISQHIALMLVLSQLITSIGGLESANQTAELTNRTNHPPETANAIAPPGNRQPGSPYPSEIATLWKDLSKLSETAASLINSDNRTLQASRNVSTSDLLVGTNSSLVQNNMTEEDDPSLIIGVITANILIFVIGFCGNSLVILVILKFTRIETVTDIYILNLAFADLMFLFGLIFLIITMFIDHWIFGNLMCKRFRRLRRAKVICFSIWIACLILMTPIFAFAKTNKDLTCAIFWPEYKSFNCEIAFTLYSFAIGFAVPLLLIAAFYTCVIRKLRIAANGPSLGSSRRSRTRETTNKRIEHLVIGIICTYTICWLPYWITQLCVSFTTTFERSPIEGFYPFVLIATCLSYTNSALNPILYAFLSDNFKRRCSDVFRSIYSVKWCPRSPAADPHSTVSTAVLEHSEVNSVRHESRQTVIMNEAVRLVTSPSQLAEILTTDMAINSNSHSFSRNSISNDSKRANSIKRADGSKNDSEPARADIIVHATARHDAHGEVSFSTNSRGTATVHRPECNPQDDAKQANDIGPGNSCVGDEDSAKRKSVVFNVGQGSNA